MEYLNECKQKYFKFVTSLNCSQHSSLSFKVTEPSILKKSSP